MLKIETLSHDGRGVGRLEGKAIFVEGALPNETVEIEIKKRHKKFDEAKATAIIEASPDRVIPQCEYVEICGGCELQHLDPHAQLKAKQETLLNQLQHFGGVTPETILEPITGEAYHYRKRARLGVRDVFKKGKVLVGFREKHTHYLVNMDHCEILDKKISNVIAPFATLIESLEARAHIAQLEVTQGDTQTAFIVRHLVPLNESDVSKLKQFAEAHEIEIYLQSKGPETVLKLWPETHPYLSYSLPAENITYQFHPLDFVQVNQIVNQKMVAAMLAAIQLKPNMKVLDLFCGLGNLTLPLAKYAGHVVGVEGSAQMVKLAQENAKRNQLENVAFYEADLFAPPFNAAWANQHYDVVVLDPPRAGAEQVVSDIQRFNANTIVYISCYPATLARDAGILKNAGYLMHSVRLLDMFTHTMHVEAMAVFKR